jgi:hypothetical protein
MIVRWRDDDGSRRQQLFICHACLLPAVANCFIPLLLGQPFCSLELLIFAALCTQSFTIYLPSTQPLL